MANHVEDKLLEEVAALAERIAGAAAESPLVGCGDVIHVSASFLRDVCKELIDSRNTHIYGP